MQRLKIIFATSPPTSTQNNTIYRGQPSWSQQTNVIKSWPAWRMFKFRGIGVICLVENMFALYHLVMDCDGEIPIYFRVANGSFRVQTHVPWITVFEIPRNCHLFVVESVDPPRKLIFHSWNDPTPRGPTPHCWLCIASDAKKTDDWQWSEHNSQTNYGLFACRQWLLIYSGAWSK
jgi:hypothetical protein